jgi:hypothetical protein
MRNVRWQEPAAFKRATAPSLPWQVGLIVAFAVAALVLIARAVIPAPNAPGWPLMILIAVGSGLAIGLFMPWFTSLFPSEVIVSPKGVNRNGFRGMFLRIQFWPWEQIARCSVGKLDLNGQSFEVLFLEDAQGGRSAIGFGAKVPVEELDAFLQNQNKRLDRLAV